LEGEHWSAAASFGSLTYSNHNRTRMLSVEVHVGDYAVDNSNFISFPSMGSGVVGFLGAVPLPLDDNYDEIRRQIWLVTDGAYKKALEDLSKKRAALENQNRAEAIADFSKQEPVTVEESRPPIHVDLKEVSEMVRNLSRTFRDAPDVFTSAVRFNGSNYKDRYLNSEGSSYVKDDPIVSLVATAAAQAADGMQVSDFAAFYGRSEAELPAAKELEARVRECAKRCAILRAAPPAAQYNGPVLFEGEAAAAILAQAFLHNVLGRPHMIGENAQIQRMLEGYESTFSTRIGARVLPASFQLIDDPTVDHYGNAALLASYKADQEGTPSRRTVVVDNGILKTLLTSRAPVRRVPQSTGNRRGMGIMPSNVFLTSANGMDEKDLRAELLRLAKERGSEYGVIVRRMAIPAFASAQQQLMVVNGAGGTGPRQEHALAAYKVYADGREELMRNAEISDITAAAFRDIAAAGKQPGIYTLPFQVRSAPFQFGGLNAGPQLVSFVVPSLLFDDVAINRPLGEIPKPPASKHPFFDR
jgi:hypothetical protein